MMGDREKETETEREREGQGEKEIEKTDRLTVRVEGQSYIPPLQLD